MGFPKTAFEKRIFRRVYYTRYVDNFLLGIRGPKFLAMDTRDETSQFIKCNLQLEVLFAEICYTQSSKIKYLGFDVKIINNKQNDASKIKNFISFKTLKNKLKHQKSLVQSREKTFLIKTLYKKISNTVNLLEKKMIPAIKHGNIKKKLIKRELLNTLNNFTHTSNLNAQNCLSHPTYTNNFKNAYKKKNNDYNATVYKTLHKYKHYASPRLYAPKEFVLKLMRDWGMISHTANKPVPNKTLQKYHDLSIILFYKHKAIGILKYYRPATNLCWIKKQVNYQMRYSLCAREESMKVSLLV